MSPEEFDKLFTPAPPPAASAAPPAFTGPTKYMGREAPPGMAWRPAGKAGMVLTKIENQYDAPDFIAAAASDPKMPAADRAKLLSFYSLTSDPEDLHDLVAAHIGGVEMAHDDKGQLGVKYNGKFYYLNQKDISSGDMPNFVGTAAVAGGAGAATNVGLKAVAAPLLAKAIVGGAVQGGVEAARQGAVQAAGGQQPLNWTNIGIASLLGAGGEAIGAPIARNAIKNQVGAYFRQIWKPGASMLDQAGNFTPEAEATIKRLGYDPGAYSQKARTDLDSLVRATGPNPADADVRQIASKVRDESLGLKSTVAQARGDFDKAAGSADNVLRSKPGEAQQHMADFTREQRQGIIDQGKTTAGDVQSVPQANYQGGNVATQEFLKAEAQSAENVRAAYKIFDEGSPEKTLVHPDQAKTLTGMGTKALNDAHIELNEATPNARSAQALVDQLGATPPQLPMGGMTGIQPEAPPVTAKTIESTRRRLSNLAATAETAADKKAMSVIIDAYDQRINGLMNTPSAIEGDTSLLPAWRRAITLRANHGALFTPKSQDIGQAANIMKKLSTEDNPDPQQVAKWIMGTEGVPDAATSPAGTRIITQLSKAAPETLPPLKQMYMARIFKGALVDQPRDVDISNLKNNLDKAIKDWDAGPDTMARQLLSPDEVTRLRGFRDHIKDIANNMASYPSSGTTERKLAVDKGPNWLRKAAPEMWKWLVTGAGLGGAAEGGAAAVGEGVGIPGLGAGGGALVGAVASGGARALEAALEAQAERSALRKARSMAPDVMPAPRLTTPPPTISPAIPSLLAEPTRQPRLPRDVRPMPPDVFKGLLENQ